MMHRRSALTLLGTSAGAWPLAATAQVAGKVWRIGVLGGEPLPALSQRYSGFLQGMRDLGYVEGKDFVSELRAADNSFERLPTLADELVRIGADVLLTASAVCRLCRRPRARFPSSWRTLLTPSP